MGQRWTPRLGRRPITTARQPIPWVNSGDLRDADIYDAPKKMKLTPGLASSSAKWVPEGSVLVAMYGATIGKTGLTRAPVTTESSNRIRHSARRSQTYVLAEWLQWYVRSKYSLLRGAGKGGASRTLRPKRFSKGEPSTVPSLKKPGCQAKAGAEIESRVMLFAIGSDRREPAGSTALRRSPPRQGAAFAASTTRPDGESGRGRRSLSMSDLKVFSLSNGSADRARRFVGRAGEVAADVVERNMETLFGVRFLASEYSTGTKHGGRIDSLGIDENGSPVIVEYKRARQRERHQPGPLLPRLAPRPPAEFQLLVMKRLGPEASRRDRLAQPRLICVAGDSPGTTSTPCTDQPQHRTGPLPRLRRRAAALELVTTTKVEVATRPDAELRRATPSTASYKTVTEYLAQAPTELRTCTPTSRRPAKARRRRHQEA